MTTRPPTREWKPWEHIDKACDLLDRPVSAIGDRHIQLAQAHVAIAQAKMTREGTSMTEPRYPDIEVQLSGEDGNAFAIMGRVQKALRRARVDEAEIRKYHAEATSGDFDHLLRTTMRWVSVH